MTTDAKALIIFLVIGLIAGFLASMVVGGGGLLRYLLLGVIGSFVVGFLFSAAGITLGTNALVSQIVTSTIGAIVVVIIARLIS